MCEGGPPLEAVASPVKSTSGATIWAELPDVPVKYVLGNARRGVRRHGDVVPGVGPEEGVVA